ncbi:hypothetical protein LKK83_27035 [Phormidium sp. CCY1219]|nr:hypothetical protein [Phormidium sp. CCY1219]MEB3831136.1 hypothetical protein [Phormidium sp. CCY1219]
MMMTSRMTLTLILAASVGLAACGGKTREEKRMRFDGIAFRTSAKAINKRETLADFRIEVRDALQSQRGALAAADHQAKRYCIVNFGTSRFDWTNIALDAEGNYNIQLDKGDAVYTGRCES